MAWVETLACGTLYARVAPVSSCVFEGFMISEPLTFSLHHKFGLIYVCVYFMFSLWSRVCSFHCRCFFLMQTLLIFSSALFVLYLQRNATKMKPKKQKSLLSCLAQSSCLNAINYVCFDIPCEWLAAKALMLHTAQHMQQKQFAKEWHKTETDLPYTCVKKQKTQATNLQVLSWDNIQIFAIFFRIFFTFVLTFHKESIFTDNLQKINFNDGIKILY